MTKSTATHFAGARFLHLARLLYSEQTVDAVFLPAVADLQEDLAAAGPSRFRRVVTRWRWHGALLVLLVAAATVPAPLNGRAAARQRQRSGGWFLALLAMTLYGGTWPFFGGFVAGALPAGLALAIAMRAWNNRHPDALAAPAGDGRDPEINLSAIHVGGDVAGLMFAAGSVAIVLLGLPALWWFVAAVCVGSVLVAVVRLQVTGTPDPDRGALSVYHR
jgi:hypothetical protein